MKIRGPTSKRYALSPKVNYAFLLRRLSELIAFPEDPEAENEEFDHPLDRSTHPWTKHEWRNTVQPLMGILLPKSRLPHYIDYLTPDEHGVISTRVFIRQIEYDTIYHRRGPPLPTRDRHYFFDQLDELLWYAARHFGLAWLKAYFEEFLQEISPPPKNAEDNPIL